MTNINSTIATLGRLLLAIIFLVSGFSKISAPDSTIAYIASAHLPFPLLGYIAAVAVEVGGGVLLLVGYQTRAVSLIIALFTIAAAVSFHNNFGDQNQAIHFLKNISISGGLLQVVAFGAGAYSIDGWLARMRRHNDR